MWVDDFQSLTGHIFQFIWRQCQRRSDFARNSQLRGYIIARRRAGSLPKAQRQSDGSK